MAKKENTHKKKKDEGINYKVILYSILGLYCLYLSFTSNWLFIIGSALAMYLNHKELFPSK